MADQFKHNLSLTFMIFLVLFLLLQTNMPFSGQLARYLEFVVNTDFDLEFLQVPLRKAQVLVQSIDVTPLIEGLPRLTTGR